MPFKICPVSRKSDSETYFVVVILPADLNKFPAVWATFIKLPDFLEKWLAVVVTTMQKFPYLVRPTAHLCICPVSGNGLYEMIQGEMQEFASYTSTKPHP